MGECITYFIEPMANSKKKGNSINWPHDFYLMELEDNELVGFALHAKFEVTNAVTNHAKEIAHYCKMRSRPMSLAERGVITRAFKQVKLVDMRGDNFVEHAKTCLANMEAERLERLALISQA